MKKSNKRILSLLTAVCMLLGMIVVPGGMPAASAASSEDTKDVPFAQHVYVDSDFEDGDADLEDLSLIHEGGSADVAKVVEDGGNHYLSLVRNKTNTTEKYGVMRYTFPEDNLPNYVVVSMDIYLTMGCDVRLYFNHNSNGLSARFAANEYLYLASTKSKSGPVEGRFANLTVAIEKTESSEGTFYVWYDGKYIGSETNSFGTNDHIKFVQLQMYRNANEDNSVKVDNLKIYSYDPNAATPVYTVTWKNDDGTVLETDEVEAGTVPTYDGATPTKETITHKVYTFSGWDTTPAAVTGDVTYTAQYTETITKCVDEDPKDHQCDICTEILSTHSWNAETGKCDICGDECVHGSGDTDHECDTCGKTLGECNDGDPKDHKCNVCGADMGVHADGDDDNHTCDYCGGAVDGDTCVDSDTDHDCDECGAPMGVHESNAAHPCQDGVCEYCGEPVAATDHTVGVINGVCDVCGAAQEEGIPAGAITSNGDSYCNPVVNGTTVTIAPTGTVRWAKSAWGTWGNWVGFRINVPTGVDATKAVYTRPGKTCALSEVLDEGKNYASVYSNMVNTQTVTYTIDWTGDGVVDLTVVIDASNATMATPVAQVGEKQYTTLAAAIADAEVGDTVKLMANAEITSDVTLKAGITYEIPAGLTLTVAEGKTVTAEAGAVLNCYGTIAVAGTADISKLVYTGTIGGNATFGACGGKLSVKATGTVKMLDSWVNVWNPVNDATSHNNMLTACENGAIVYVGTQKWVMADDAWAHENHADSDTDHDCDACGTTMGVHESNADHTCVAGKCEYCGADMPATTSHSYTNGTCACGAVAAGAVNGTYYDTLQDAIDNAAETTVSVELNDNIDKIVVPADKTVVIDFNGKTVNEIVVNGTLYGIDETTKDYNATPVKVKISGTGTVAPVHQVDTDDKAHTYAGYAAQVSEGYATFNYFEVKISSVTLRPSEAGIGYKLYLAGNANVKAMLGEDDAFGVTVYKDGNEAGGKSAKAGSASFNVGTQTKMVMIKNILSGNDAEQNATNGNVKLCVSAYVNINGEKVEIAYTAGKSLVEVFNSINDNLGSYNDVQKAALKTLYNTYIKANEQVFTAEGWKFDKIKEITDPEQN